MKDRYIALIGLSLVIGIPTLLGYYFWSYEPSVNQNNLLKTFDNATDYTLSSRKIANFQINEIKIKNGLPVYCDANDFNCIELNMTNPISYVGKFTALQIDELKPICHKFQVWENGSVKDIGIRAYNDVSWENHCQYRTVANLPNDASLQIKSSVSQESKD